MIVHSNMQVFEELWQFVGKRAHELMDLIDTNQRGFEAFRRDNMSSAGDVVFEVPAWYRSQCSEFDHEFSKAYALLEDVTNSAGRALRVIDETKDYELTTDMNAKVDRYFTFDESGQAHEATKEQYKEAVGDADEQASMDISL